LVLRHTQPQLERPFCVPGYPWVPLLFCAGAVGLVLNTVIKQPMEALIGVGLIGVGIPVYFFLSNLRRVEVKNFGV